MSSEEADGILRLMAAEHEQNRGDIDELKEGQTTLTATVNILSTALTSLVSKIDGGTQVLKLFAWIVMATIAFLALVVTALGIWFASLEARGKVADKPPVGISSNHTPQDAGTTPSKAY